MAAVPNPEALDGEPFVRRQPGKAGDGVQNINCVFMEDMLFLAKEQALRESTHCKAMGETGIGARGLFSDNGLI